MNAYIYRAALLCEDCATLRRTDIHPTILAAADEEGDSDVAPQGPYADGGGEADAPCYCDHCGVFLQNPLTPAGYEYVAEMARDKSSHDSVIKEWRLFYDL